MRNPIRRHRDRHASSSSALSSALRPVIEELEVRTFFSIITVNSAADDTTAGDGLVTLREAIIAANNNTTTDLGDTGSSSADLIDFNDGSFVGGTNFTDQTPTRFSSAPRCPTSTPPAAAFRLPAMARIS
jgi:hypothetical protein